MKMKMKMKMRNGIGSFHYFVLLAFGIFVCLISDSSQAVRTSSLLSSDEPWSCQVEDGSPALTYFNKGDELFLSGKFEGALDCYDKGFALSGPNEKHLRFRLNRGATLAALKRYDEAYKVLAPLHAYAKKKGYYDKSLCNNFGNVLQRTGRIAEASSVFGEIIKHDPRSIESWSGKVSLHLTDQSNSLDYVDQLTLEILEKFPTDTTAYEWRAQALIQLQRFVESTQTFEKALSIARTKSRVLKSSSSNPINLTSSVITSDNQTLSDLDWVIQNANDSSLPLSSHFYYNYGLALFNSFGTVSGDPVTLRNAERLMVAAKTRTPEEDHVYIIHSEILKTAKQYNQAYNMLAAVLKLRPQSVQLHLQVGALLQKTMPKKAAEHFDLAVFSMETSKQTGTIPYLNTLLNLFGSRQASCIWEGTDRLVEKIKATFIDVCGKDTENPQLPGRCGRTINVGPADLLRYPLDLHYTTRVAQTWADRASMIAGSFQAFLKSKEPIPYQHSVPALGTPAFQTEVTRRLKIGYLSTYFGNHPTAHLMMGVFKSHNRSSFEVHCLSLSSDDQSLFYRQNKRSCDKWIDLIDLSDVQLAEGIRALHLDILVDLNGYMEGARENALAARPAPLQLSLVSYLGPMGADWIDYMLADSVVLPPERIGELPTEKFISLESPSFFVAGYASAFASSGSISAPPLPSPEEAKLPNIKLLSDTGEELFIDLDENKDKEEEDDGLEFGRILSEDDNEEEGAKKPMEKVPPKPAKNKFIFCNFGQNFKIDSKLFDVWMRILKRVPNSVLWLLSLPEDSVESLETEALKRGVNPRTRLIFTPRINKIAHLKRMARYADLFLDTPRFNGHTSAVDALWSGVPLITVPGELLIGRVTASLLTAAKVPELIASDLEEYEETAVKLAKDPKFYNQIRQKVIDGREFVFDTQEWTRKYEVGLRRAWVDSTTARSKQQ